jgi:hypothetical protein
VAINWPMDHMLVSYEGYAATFSEIRPMLIQQAVHPSNIEVDRRRELDSSERGESVTTTAALWMPSAARLLYPPIWATLRGGPLRRLSDASIRRLPLRYCLVAVKPIR